MSQHPFNLDRFTSITIGLLCLNFTLAPNEVSANPSTTNMSHGSGCNMSHGSGSHKGGDNGNRHHSVKAGEIKQLLGSHQRAHSLASQRLSAIKSAGNYTQLPAAQAAEASAAQALAQAQAQARQFLSIHNSSFSPSW